ncbi:MAG: hypothetical protein EOR07_31215 [Mesorhizobium sp.]|nr:MAG: hypothetical protein EOR07_31215 [Mesorhizobium sp.]
MDALKMVGALLCGAGLLLLIYIQSDEQRSSDFNDWVDQNYSSDGIIENSVAQPANRICSSVGEGLRCIIPAVKEALPYLSILSSLIAAGLGIRAATCVIRDSLDDFMSDIARQGRWASWAAVAAGLSVVLQALDRLGQ